MKLRADTKKSPVVSFLKELMRLKKRLPSQMAAELGVSHATVSRWLSGEDKPSIQSYRKMAEYSGIPMEKILVIAGQVPGTAEAEKEAAQWPEFREYASQKYPDELDEDLITMIEDLIERRRARKFNWK